MKNRRAFTLIELLAVIVIISIILAISIPSVTSSIEKSRENAFKASTKNVMRKIELAVVAARKTSGEMSGYISDLDISNNNLSGTWSYNGQTKTTTVCGLTDGKVGIVGNSGCITSTDDINTSVAGYKNIKMSDLFSSSNLNSYSKLSADGNYILDNDNKNYTQPNNYVWYSGRLWRAYKKDATGVSLITDLPQTSISFGSSSTYSSSYAKTWLETIFLPSLESGASSKGVNTSTIGLILANGTNLDYDKITNLEYNSSLAGAGYCTDPNGNTVSQYSNEASCIVNYSCTDPAYTNQASCEAIGGCYSDYYYTEYWPQYNNNRSACEGAGGYFEGPYNYWGQYYWNDTSKQANYLNSNTFIWWATPTTSGSGQTGTIYPSFGLTNDYVSTSFSVRPIIRINNGTSISSGNGTLNNPYVINNNTQNNVGEYIKMPTVFNKNQLWRIQDKNVNNLRLIMNNVYFNSGVGGNFSASSTNNFNISDVKTRLNNAYNETTNPYGIFTQTQLNRLQTSTFYTGTYSGDYRNTLSTSTTATVGLPRIGEMFASQSMYNKDNSGIYNYMDDDFWTLTPRSSYELWYVSSASHGWYSYYSSANGVRPIVSIDSSLIKSGSGTLNNPYVIE